MRRGDIADALRKFRRALDMTQEDMARKLGLKRTTYTSYEQGIAQPPGGVVARLKELGFGTDVSDPRIPALQIYIPIAFIGGVSASAQVDWTDPFESETFEYVPPEMGEARGRFAARILSDSCYDLLWPGDIAVFQKDETPRIGQVILYRSRDRRITVKQLKHSGENYVLHPLNPTYDDEPADGEVVGFLVGIVRQDGSRRVTIYDEHGIRP